MTVDMEQRDRLLISKLTAAAACVYLVVYTGLIEWLRHGGYNNGDD